MFQLPLQQTSDVKWWDDFAHIAEDQVTKAKVQKTSGKGDAGL